MRSCAAAASTWAPADQSTLDRSTAHHKTALVARRNLLELGPTQRDRDNYRDQPHQVHLVHYPAARVYGVSATYNDKSVTKIKQIMETLTVPDKHAAVLGTISWAPNHSRPVVWWIRWGAVTAVCDQHDQHPSRGVILGRQWGQVELDDRWVDEGADWDDPIGC